MTADDRFSRLLADVLDDIAPRSMPDYLDEVLARTARTRQRPAWTFPERWFPMVAIARPVFVQGRSPLLILIIIAALLAAVAVALVGSRPQALPTTDEYTLDLDATELASWTRDPPARGPGDYYLARSRDRRFPDKVIGDLTVERPDRVFERGGRESIAVPSDLVGWLTHHPSLALLGTSSLLLDGRQATVLDALPVFPARDVSPDTWRSWYARDPQYPRYPSLLPTLFLDAAWRYRFVVVDLDGTGWLVASCGALQETWSEAARACEELLATWEWVDR